MGVTENPCIVFSQGNVVALEDGRRAEISELVKTGPDDPYSQSPTDNAGDCLVVNFIKEVSEYKLSGTVTDCGYCPGCNHPMRTRLNVTK